MAGSTSDSRGYDMDPRDIEARRDLFAQSFARLILYAYSRGYRLHGVDVCPLERRRSHDGVQYRDGVHMSGSLHYQRLAGDVALYVGGSLVQDGLAPAFVDLGTYWEGLDPLCRWGGRFKSVDGCHFSVAYGGRA